MKKLTLFTLLFFLVGCSSVTLYRDEKTRNRPQPLVYDRTIHTAAAFGVIPYRSKHDIKDLCPNNWVAIRKRMSPFDVIITTLTLSIYSRMTVEVACYARLGIMKPPVGSSGSR